MQIALRMSFMRHHVAYMGVRAGVGQLFGSELRLLCQRCGFSFSLGSQGCIEPAVALGLGSPCDPGWEALLSGSPFLTYPGSSRILQLYREVPVTRGPCSY